MDISALISALGNEKSNKSMRFETLTISVDGKIVVVRLPNTFTVSTLNCHHTQREIRNK